MITRGNEFEWNPDNKTYYTTDKPLTVEQIRMAMKTNGYFFAEDDMTNQDYIRKDISVNKLKGDVIFLDTLFGCARCTYNHEGIKFRVMLRPIGEYTHWSICPETAEPILLKVGKSA